MSDDLRYQAQVDTDNPTGAGGSTPDTTTSEPVSAKSDPVRRFAVVVLLVLVVILIWYVLADRYAPWTDQARVWGPIVALAPKVSGKVKQIEVVDNQAVEAGDLLLKIDPRPYELAVQRAEAQLAIAGQSTGADTAMVKAAEATVGQTRASLRQATLEQERLERIFQQDSGAVSQAARDQAQSALAEAQSAEANALAELERAQQQLGEGGEENAQVRDATAALEQARIDLEETKVYAPSTGGITNLNIDEGHYAKAGTPVMTFASFTEVWVQANMRENSMRNIEPGAKVDILLDQLPGSIFSGTVASKGFAVKQPSYGYTGDLITIKSASGWLRDAQRFPVIIHFSDESAYGYRLAGGQADVQFYGQNTALNALGWTWIRLLSLLSYIY
jgi:multidrug resistance efflux pump